VTSSTTTTTSTNTINHQHQLLPSSPTPLPAGCSCSLPPLQNLAVVGVEPLTAPVIYLCSSIQRAGAAPSCFSALSLSVLLPVVAGVASMVSACDTRASLRGFCSWPCCTRHSPRTPNFRLHRFFDNSKWFWGGLGGVGVFLGLGEFGGRAGGGGAAAAFFWLFEKRGDAAATGTASWLYLKRLATAFIRCLKSGMSTDMHGAAKSRLQNTRHTEIGHRPWADALGSIGQEGWG
jgi:hypothetical protein